MAKNRKSKEEQPAAAEIAAPSPVATAGPTIGRIVHYVLPERSPRSGQKRAAIVTSTSGEKASLRVYLDGVLDIPSDHAYSARYTVCGKLDLQAVSVAYDETCKPGTWHWPRRD